MTEASAAVTRKARPLCCWWPKATGQRPPGQALASVSLADAIWL